MADPFAQLYPFASSATGPTLSGLPNQASTLSGTLPGQVSQGGAQAGQYGQGGYGGLASALFQSLTPNQPAGQPGRTLTTTLNPILSALSPNLMATFGAYGGQASQPQQNAGSAYYGLGTPGSDTSLNLLLDQLRLASGQPSTAEQLQVASNRNPGETTQQTAERMQLNPLGGQISNGIFSPAGAFNALQQAIALKQGIGALTGPNAPALTSQEGASAGLGTAGSVLQLAGQIPGLDAQTAQTLAALGKGSALGGLALNPDTLIKLMGFSPTNAFSSPPPLPNVTNIPSNVLGQAGTIANLAGGALGVAGPIASLAGASPQVQGGLNIGSTLAGAAGSGAQLATTGSLNALSGLGLGGAGGVLGALGPLLGAAGLIYAPYAFGSALKGIAKAGTKQEEAHYGQQASSMLKRLQGTYAPQAQQALAKLQAGDTSGLGQLAETWRQLNNTEMTLRSAHSNSPGAPAALANIQKARTNLVNAVHQANPAAYGQLLNRMAQIGPLSTAGFHAGNTLYAPSGLLNPRGTPVDVYRYLNYLANSGAALPLPPGVTAQQLAAANAAPVNKQSPWYGVKNIQREL